jgi:hypothetical protein
MLTAQQVLRKILEWLIERAMGECSGTLFVFFVTLM